MQRSFLQSSWPIKIHPGCCSCLKLCSWQPIKTKSCGLRPKRCVYFWSQLFFLQQFLTNIDPLLFWQLGLIANLPLFKSLNSQPNKTFHSTTYRANCTTSKLTTIGHFPFPKQSWGIFPRLLSWLHHKKGTDLFNMEICPAASVNMKY